LVREGLYPNKLYCQLLPSRNTERRKITIACQREVTLSPHSRKSLVIHFDEHGNIFECMKQPKSSRKLSLSLSLIQVFLILQIITYIYL
jgi:ADP-glucose pyrophosphorylase